MTLRARNYENYGIWLIMGDAGCISSAVVCFGSLLRVSREATRQGLGFKVATSNRNKSHDSGHMQRAKEGWGLQGSQQGSLVRAEGIPELMLQG